MYRRAPRVPSVDGGFFARSHPALHRMHGADIAGRARSPVTSPQSGKSSDPLRGIPACRGAPPPQGTGRFSPLLWSPPVEAPGPDGRTPGDSPESLVLFLVREALPQHAIRGPVNQGHVLITMF
jgi:hypothetical protein